MMRYCAFVSLWVCFGWLVSIHTKKEQYHTKKEHVCYHVPNTIEWRGETSINKWKIAFNMLQLNGVKWRKKRFGENRNDWILGAPVCLSLRFSGWILNEESSLSLSPCHRGWSQSSPLRGLLLQVYREGAPLLLLLLSPTLPAPLPPTSTPC